MDPLRLVGTWDFWREVHDHRDGAEYAARGEATFTADDDGRVRWSERGTLTWAGGSTSVSRTLFLVPEPPEKNGVAPGWRVTFEDGRDFHPWTAGAVEHLCGRDLYEGGVAIPLELSEPPHEQTSSPGPAPSCPAPSWDLTWRVTGPEKDYTMHTRYARPHESASSRPGLPRSGTVDSEET